MGVVTVSIDDDVEERFREKLDELGNEKGAMGEAISEALDVWMRRTKDEKLEWQRIAEEGVEMGGEEFDRDEANER